jgi:hypothetical protein
VAPPTLVGLLIGIDWRRLRIEHRFRLPPGTTWARAEVYRADRGVGMLALTSAIFLRRG